MDTTSVVDVDTLPVLLHAYHIRQLTDLSMPTVYELLRRKGCPVVRFGRAIRVFRDPFLRWLEEQTRVDETPKGA
jgi:excisionase family DNA binding protein